MSGFPDDLEGKIILGKNPSSEVHVQPQVLLTQDIFPAQNLEGPKQHEAIEATKQEHYDTLTEPVKDTIVRIRTLPPRRAANRCSDARPQEDLAEAQVRDVPAPCARRKRPSLAEL